MQQCFPVWDRLQYLISVEDLEPALSQAKTWSRQLDEVIEIAERGEN
jgi:Mor family transcriptional regulator